MFNIIKHWFLYKTKGWMKAPRHDKNFRTSGSWSYFFCLINFFILLYQCWYVKLSFLLLFFFLLYECWYVSFLLLFRVLLFTLSVLICEFSFAPRSVTSLPRRQLMNLHNNEAGRRVSFDRNLEIVTFVLQIVFSYIFFSAMGIILPCGLGVAPSSNIYKSNSPSTRPPPVKEPNLPNKAGACFIGAHHCQNLTTIKLIIITGPWFNIMKIQIYENTDDFFVKTLISTFFRRWSRTWRWLSPSLRWITLKTKDIC